ncbi:hypothetical protein SCAR479_01236 [Seiridium cardinale]|uniref:Uncharacterized protein n=1 Tax=Seiridium cardinale TaxID=138064 RepID=A0ABR2Y835_9PEZI
MGSYVPTKAAGTHSGARSIDVMKLFQERAAAAGITAKKELTAADMPYDKGQWDKDMARNILEPASCLKLVVDEEEMRASCARASLSYPPPGLKTSRWA